MPSPGCMRSATKQSAADTSSSRLNRLANCLTSVRSQTPARRRAERVGADLREALRDLVRPKPLAAAPQQRPDLGDRRGCGSAAASIHAPIDGHVRGRVAQDSFDGVSVARRQAACVRGAEADQARAVLAGVTAGFPWARRRRRRRSSRARTGAARAAARSSSSTWSHESPPLGEQPPRRLRRSGSGSGGETPRARGAGAGAAGPRPSRRRSGSAMRGLATCACERQEHAARLARARPGERRGSRSTEKRPASSSRAETVPARNAEFRGRARVPATSVRAGRNEREQSLGDPGAAARAELDLERTPTHLALPAMRAMRSCRCGSGEPSCTCTRRSLRSLRCGREAHRVVRDPVAVQRSVVGEDEHACLTEESYLRYRAPEPGGNP